MSTSLELAGCACIPSSSLPALAALRRRGGIAVTVAGDLAWVRWDAGDESVLRRLFPLPGVELFARRDGHWYRLGDHLPSFGLPVDSEEGLPLYRLILPEPVRPEPPKDDAPTPARLGLRRDDHGHPATALRCSLEALGRWAETATTARLTALLAARSGDVVLLLGETLPPIAGAERFWGDRVLVPLGFRPEPELSDRAICGALRAAEGEVVVLGAEGAERVPRSAFRTLSRAGVRLAMGADSP